MDPVRLSLFVNRINGICDQMGAVLCRAAFSPNIRDRLDYSCALFDPQGELCAQAAHIPVHLGSMAYAMADVIHHHHWAPGDILVLNDPYLGGTHLPDVTVIMPVFVDSHCIAFVANRAHHSDIGAESAGSLPLSSSLEEEGVVISPTLLGRAGTIDAGVLDSLTRRMNRPELVAADFSAQVAAARSGCEQLQSLLSEIGSDEWLAHLSAVNDYAERLSRAALAEIPAGEYEFEDVMDDDGFGHEDLPIRLRMRVDGDGIALDFSGTADQVEGNINCPLSVTAAATLYAFRCLMPVETPGAAGAFRAIHLSAPRGCLLNAESPAAVAAGNVETSQRITDVVIGALARAMPDRMPAASQGGMNNLAMGSRRGSRWDYYETIGGGTGGHARGPGLDGVHSHMTNTLNTPLEVIEMNWPLQVITYAIRADSGGHGRHRGGNGLVREYRFLDEAEVSIISERRRRAPWGLAGGRAGQAGANSLNGRALPGKCRVSVKTGDCLRIETPGGGAWGEPGGP